MADEMVGLKTVFKTFDIGALAPALTEYPSIRSACQISVVGAEI